MAFFPAITLDRRRRDSRARRRPRGFRAGRKLLSSTSSFAMLQPLGSFDAGLFGEGRGREVEKVFLSSRRAKPSTLEQIPLARLRPLRWVVGNSLARRVSVKTSLSTRKISYCESSERRQSATSARILERGLRRWRNIIPKGRMILQPLRSRHCLSNDSTDESQHSPFTIQSL